MSIFEDLLSKAKQLRSIQVLHVTEIIGAPEWWSYVLPTFLIAMHYFSSLFEVFSTHFNSILPECDLRCFGTELLKIQSFGCGQAKRSSGQILQAAAHSGIGHSFPKGSFTSVIISLCFVFISFSSLDGEKDVKLGTGH